MDSLLLNADNCARENKNRWMFPFLGFLVERGYFNEIELHFLMPGHSHEKVSILIVRRSRPGLYFASG